MAKRRHSGKQRQRTPPRGVLAGIAEAAQKRAARLR